MSRFRVADIAPAQGVATRSRLAWRDESDGDGARRAPTMNADLLPEATGITPRRRALLPAPTLPLVYFGGAHVALAMAFSMLALDPGIPGAFHFQPRNAQIGVVPKRDRFGFDQ